MVDTQVIKERTLLQELACKDDIFSSGPLQRNRGHDVLSGNPTRYCLDRDWRKAVFHLLNNAAKKLQLPLPYRDLGEKRFDVKVLPFSWFYVQNLHELVCGENESQCPRDMKETVARLAINSELGVLSKSLCSDPLPDLLSSKQIKPRLIALRDALVRKLPPHDAENWNRFVEYVDIADRHDIARCAITCMNAQRGDVLKLSVDRLTDLLDLLQTLLDASMDNSHLIFVILFDLVSKSQSLPKSLVLTDISLRTDSTSPAAGGAFADVWEGTFEGRSVALKVLRDFNNPDGIRKELCREVIVWRQLKHPNILPFYGLYEGGFSSRFAMVSAWRENGDIVKYLKNYPEADRFEISRQLAHGLKAMHENCPPVYHGDLKAANVLVDNDGRPQICDFGLVQVAQIQTLMKTQTGITAGSTRWQSPELIRGLEHDPGECDVYALAMTFYEIYSGNIPFSDLRDGRVVMELIHGCRPEQPPNLQGELWRLVEQCWSQDRGDRPDASRICAYLDDIKTQDNGEIALEGISRLTLNQREDAETEYSPQTGHFPWREFVPRSFSFSSSSTLWTPDEAISPFQSPTHVHQPSISPETFSPVTTTAKVPVRITNDSGEIIEFTRQTNTMDNTYPHRPRSVSFQKAHSSVVVIESEESKRVRLQGLQET